MGDSEPVLKKVKFSNEIAVNEISPVPSPRSSEALISLNSEDYINEEMIEEEYVDETEDPTAKGDLFSRPNDFPVEPFNLRKERELGKHVDDLGHIIERKTKDEIDEEENMNDPWLRYLAENKNDLAIVNNNKDIEDKTKSKLRSNIIPTYLMIEQLQECLNAEETIIQALSRLGKRRKDPEALKNIEKISDLCSILLDVYPNVYDKNKNELSRIVNSYRHEIMNKTLWEYKLITSTNSTETNSNENHQNVFGPFTSLEMQSWTNQGYFQGDNIVMIRKYMKKENGFDNQKKESFSELKHDLQDLNSSDEESSSDNENKVTESLDSNKENKWIRSDEVSFTSVNLIAKIKLRNEM